MRLNSADSETMRPCQIGGQQFVLADHAVTVPDEMDQEIEDLGLDGNQGAATQFAAVGVEDTVFKQVTQITLSPWPDEVCGRNLAHQRLEQKTREPYRQSKRS